jgi:hypothetical protein
VPNLRQVLKPPAAGQQSPIWQQHIGHEQPTHPPLTEAVSLYSATRKISCARDYQKSTKKKHYPTEICGEYPPFAQYPSMNLAQHSKQSLSASFFASSYSNRSCAAVRKQVKKFFKNQQLRTVE